jgi:hypothetical protein
MSKRKGQEDMPKDPAYVTLFLVSPERELGDGDEDEDLVGYTSDPVEYERAWDFYNRVQKVLQALGGTTHDRSSVTIEGFNWEGKANGETFFLNAEAVAKFEGIVAERERLRAEGLALLSDAQKDALGLYDMKPVHHWH